MPATVPATSAPRWNILPALLIALLLTNILLFIDEGAYNFRWMLDAGNWFAFALYVAASWTGQLLVYRFMFTQQHYRRRLLLSAFVGIPLGIAILFTLALLYVAFS